MKKRGNVAISKLEKKNYKWIYLFPAPISFNFSCILSSTDYHGVLYIFDKVGWI